MTGGQVIIPIRGVNNEKIYITSVAQSIKPGTYQKIKRAIEMQKELVFNDIMIDWPSTTAPTGKIICSASSVPVFPANTSTGVLRFTIYTNTTSGTPLTLILSFTNDDKVAAA